MLQEIKKEADLVKEKFIKEIKFKLDLEGGEWDIPGARNYKATTTRAMQSTVRCSDCVCVARTEFIWGWGGDKGGKIRKVRGSQIMVNLNDRLDILLLSLSFKCYLIPTIP